MFEWIGRKFYALWTNIKFITIFEYQGGVIFRIGKFRKNILKGIHWTIPFFGRFKIANNNPETFKITAVTIISTKNLAVTISVFIEC